jgi:WD40 repeat protein/tRNA A-37 threonylcarbamoyl transferase component Bud32
MTEREIFFEALDKATPEERKGYLDDACGHDLTLRRKVEELLEEHFSNDSLLQEPTVQGAPTQLDQSPVLEGLGTQIGRYKLLQKLGEGGFGVVYMAEQKEPVKRRVALKIIKLGMDTKQVVARFEAERQALAMMDHPNIAKVHDAGATDAGRPYFVMELVKGVPITKYCDENELTTKERLELFIPVCQAIQHAHQKGVIHRDIKPSNIMVTLHDGVPVPKVIDFGIAKATQQELTEQTIFTQYGQFIGTPAYMSPEQAEMSGLDIDTRSDIYSLGVVLYELLVGRTPLDPKELLSGGLEEIRRRIKEEEAIKPSTRLSTLEGPELTAVAKQRKINPAQLRNALRGDLDWVVMKTLEKDRTRRYETVNGLALDLKRYLGNEPVTAVSPSPGYLIAKFVRRHRATLMAAAVFVLLLVAGTMASTWQAIRATRERDNARHLLYVAKMNLAQQAWEQNNIERLRQMLAETQPLPDRGFEWYYWEAQTRLARESLRAHEQGVWCMALSRDGQRLVTGSKDFTVKLWDWKNGRELRTFPPEGAWIVSLAFSPDGRRIVSGTSLGHLSLWDANTGENLFGLDEAVPPGSQSYTSVAFSPDSQWIGTGSALFDTVRLWEARTGQPVLTFTGHVHAVTALAFSPDSKRVASGSSDGTVKIWQVAGGKELLTSNGHAAEVDCVAFSNDGNRFLTASEDSTAKIWDASSGRELRTLAGHIGPVRSAVFSRDGAQVLTGSSDRTAKLWDAETGRQICTFKGHGSDIRSVAISPDGEFYFTASYDGFVKIWQSTDGLVSDETGRQELTFKGHTNDVWPVIFFPDGQRIATGSVDGTAKIWDTHTGNEVRSVSGSTNAVYGLACSPDGKHLVTSGSDPTVRIWDASSGVMEHAISGHSLTVMCAKYSADGQRIVTASWDNTVKVWDATHGTNLITLRGPSDRAWCAAFSPNGRQIVTGWDDKVGRVYDAGSGVELASLRGHREAILAAAFSPNGKWIVTGGGDYTAMVWNVATGKMRFPLKGHSFWVWSVAYSPDGQRILSTSDDGTIKLWDADTGLEVLTLKGRGAELRGAAFSPDGRRIISASRDWTARMWEAPFTEQVLAWQQ